MINYIKQLTERVCRKMSTNNVVGGLQSATFGLGCFWGSEAQYAVAPGVLRTRVGYTGGTTKNPTYKSIGDHTESVLVDYDPQVITYENLLSIFWSAHDPTFTHKKQYMSAIFFHDTNQKNLAEDTMREEQKRYRTKISTEISPAETFYDAEDYHQKYYFRSYPQLFQSFGLDGTAVKESTVAAKLNGFIGGFGSLEQFEKESAKFNLNERQLENLRQIIANAPKVRCH